MTIYTAGVAKDCCIDKPPPSYGTDVNALNNYKNSVFNGFTATLEYQNQAADPEGTGFITKYCEFSKNWDRAYELYYPDPYIKYNFTYEGNPPKAISKQGLPRKFFDLMCGIDEKYIPLINRTHTFKYVFDYTGIPDGSLQAPTTQLYSILDETVEYSLPYIEDAYGPASTPSCNISFQPVLQSAGTPQEGDLVIIHFAGCVYDGQWQNIYPEDISSRVCPSIGFIPPVFAKATNVSFLTSVFPDTIQAKFLSAPVFQGNKQILYDCYKKSFALNWDYTRAYYISDWLECGGQPFRVIGNITQSLLAYPRGKIRFDRGCPLTIEKTILPVSYWIFYPGYPNNNYATSGPNGTGHGNYGTAGFFDFESGYGIVGEPI